MSVTRTAATSCADLVLTLPRCAFVLQFHAASNTHIATVLSKDEHTVLAARAAASPLFVLPLSKKPGSFQTLLLQWQPRRLLVTTVEEFKQWGPQAPPHLTVQLFEELKESHGLVLARGDLINPQLISAPEVGGCLGVCTFKGTGNNLGGEEALTWHP